MRSSAPLALRWRESSWAGIVLAWVLAQVAWAGDLPQPTLPEADATLPIAAPPIATLFASPTTRDHVGRVVVPVMINGQGPFRFMVDTGANHSTISPRLVRLLGLTPTQGTTILVDGITGTGQVAYVTIDRLQAGDLTIDGTELPVVWAPVMAGADGILGAAGLNEKSLLIDFQRNRVEIASHVESLARAQSIKIHAGRLTYGLVTLDTRVGRVPVLAVVDTGSERTLGNIALRDALMARRAPGATVQMTSVYGATEQVEPGELHAAPEISIESLRITDVAIVYGDFHIFKVWALNDRPAMIIGMDVLGTVGSLSIDFKNQNIYVASVRNSDNTLPFSHGSLSDMSQKK
jgi:predicted aspartyl protease